MSLGGSSRGWRWRCWRAGDRARRPLREDASLAGFYLISLALGVLLVSLRGSNIDLLHVLFGTVLAIDDGAAADRRRRHASAVVDAGAHLSAAGRRMLRSRRSCAPSGARVGLCTLLFLILVVLNLVAGFQALGTLMAVGLMMLPAAAARLLGARSLEPVR